MQIAVFLYRVHSDFVLQKRNANQKKCYNSTNKQQKVFLHVHFNGKRRLN